MSKRMEYIIMLGFLVLSNYLMLLPNMGGQFQILATLWNISIVGSLIFDGVNALLKK